MDKQLTKSEEWLKKAKENRKKKIKTLSVELDIELYENMMDCIELSGKKKRVWIEEAIKAKIDSFSDYLK